MKTIRCFFFLFTAIAASSALGQQAVTLGLRTVREQAALLRSPSLDSAVIARSHIRKAESLWREMEMTKPTPPIRTGAYGKLKPLIFHLESARRAGVGYEASLDEILGRSSAIPVLKQMRKTAGLNIMKSAKGLGLLTPEGMARSERELAPEITKGNPKYIGQKAWVEHRVPYSVRPGFENEIANLELLPESVNRKKWAHIDEIARGQMRRLESAYWAQNAIAGGAKAAIGIWVLLQETPQAWAAIGGLNSASPEQRLPVLLSVGEHSSFTVMGGGLATEGFAQVAAGFSKSASTVTRLASIGKWGGRLGWAGFVVAEGFAIAEFQTGAINERQFYTSQAALLAGTGGGVLAGVLSGAGAGFVLGVETGPGVVITTVVGGFAGGYAASKAATFLVEGYYSSLDENQKRQVREFIYQHYDVRP
jgi:hypothetical protein